MTNYTPTGKNTLIHGVAGSPLPRPATRRELLGAVGEAGDMARDEGLAAVFVYRTTSGWLYSPDQNDLEGTLMAIVMSPALAPL